MSTRWTAYVVRDDWPRGVGVGSHRLDRKDRYDVLGRFPKVFDGAMADLADAPERGQGSE